MQVITLSLPQKLAFSSPSQLIALNAYYITGCILGAKNAIV